MIFRPSQQVPFKLHTGMPIQTDKNADYKEVQNEDTPNYSSTPTEAPSSIDNIHWTDGVTDDSLADEVNKIQEHLGGYGRYQIFIYVLISLVYMRGGWHVWIPIYQALDPGYHCSASPNLPLNESVPGTVEDGVWTYSQCQQYVNKSVNNDTTTCSNGWTYLWDSDYTSIVSEYDLVCKDDYQIELTTTIYMVGTTCGVVFLTPLADRFGSKTVMLVCLWVQAVIGTCLIWAGNIIVFCVLKFFIGVCNMTVALSSFVLMTEMFDATHREVPIIAMQFFWALSIMSLALFGYLIPKWEDLELTIALPVNVLSLAYVVLIPDSLPWLLSKGKVKQAERVIARFLKINKLPAIPDLQKKLEVFKKDGNHRKQENSIQNQKVQDEKTETKAPDKDGETEGDSHVYTVYTLFKSKRLAINTLIMFYLFLINALAYFGIMYSTPELDGNRFLNLFLLGVVEIPAYIFCFISNRLIGRRRSISIFLFICAVTNLAVIFIPDETDDGKDLTKLKTALVIIGKFGITGSYSAIYLFATEIFPTVVRNQAVGASSFFENIGSIAAPNMVYVNNSMNNLPLGIFGGMTIVGCGLVLLLPETRNRPLPQTIADVEKWGKKKEDDKDQAVVERYRKTNAI